MVKQSIDGVEFKLRGYQDFSWLKDFGTVFSVIDETGSGCISFGVEKEHRKYFLKIAGAKTVEAEVSEEESIQLLKSAVEKYRDIRHPDLIRLENSFSIREFFVAVFDWAEGECLFDHWNFDFYQKNPQADTPMKKFKRLPVEKRLRVAEKLFSFFETVVSSGYAAVDFYDSSIIYDFQTDKATFCDIDLFRKTPTVNDLGTDYFGTKRLKAPEENQLGAEIDEKTNEFTLGALLFDLFSTKTEYEKRYELGMFIPNKREDFELSGDKYQILMKATCYDREERFASIREFREEWENAD